MLRIEDTDLERSDKAFEKNIFEGLKWLGIEADESPEVGGSFAPYRQSERTTTYTKYINQLLHEGYAFYCFHSESELEEEKEKLLQMKISPIHVCEYRNFMRSDAEKLAETKSDYIIRFKTPSDRIITFNDIIRGEVSFDSALLGDFSIAKRTDIPLYNFAVVVDDHEMKISHVIRGEDHIANTPRQLLIIQALNFAVPVYAHLPLILGPDRSKLSKRHGATSLNEYREQGYLPEALFNFMALLGWNPGGDQEIFTKDELVQKFSLGRIQKSGAIFDVTKLDWMNGEYIRALSAEELYDRVGEFLPEQANTVDPERVKKILMLEQPRLKKLSELKERTVFFFTQPDYDKDLLRWKKMSDAEIKNSLILSLEIMAAMPTGISVEEVEKVFMDRIGIGDKGMVLWPLRAALSGKKASPSPFEIIEVLGKEETKKRIRHAINFFAPK